MQSSSNEDIIYVVTDEDSVKSLAIDLPSVVQRRTSDESTVFSITQAAEATHQFQTSPQVFQPKRGLSAITSSWVSDREISEALMDDGHIGREKHIFRQFSASLSDIMSKVTCADLGGAEPDKSLLKDEEFYWPSNAQSFDSCDDMNSATSSNFQLKSFYVSDSSLAGSLAGR